MNISKFSSKLINVGAASATVLATSLVAGSVVSAASDGYDCTLTPGSDGYNPVQAGLCDSVSEGNRVNIFSGENPIFQRVVNILLFLVGAISVIMLIIGGIRYIVSAGDQNAVTGAKNTIMYAIVGIIVAVVAYGAVNFVLSQLLSTGA